MTSSCYMNVLCMTEILAEICEVEYIRIGKDNYPYTPRKPHIETK